MVMLRVGEHATPVGPTEDSLVSCLTRIARRESRAGARNQLPSEGACCRDCAAIEWAERSNSTVWGQRWSTQRCSPRSPLSRTPSGGGLRSAYRLWRDLGFAVGALVAGVTANVLGMPPAIAVVAVLTAVSGIVVLVRMRETLDRKSRPSPSPARERVMKVR